MWTYLLIFLSVLVLAIVFIRRLYLNLRKSVPAKVVEKKEDTKPEKEAVSRKEKLEAESLCRKGEDLAKRGNEDAAIKNFVQALAIDPAHLETKHRLAMLYMDKQMFSAAAALFRELAEETDDAVCYSHLGLALFNQNEFEEAKKAYQSAVSLDDSRPQRFASLAQVYRATGELQNAIIAMSKAVELGDENVDYLVLLAEIYLEKGDKEGVETQIVAIEKISPSHEVLDNLRKEARKIETAKNGAA